MKRKTTLAQCFIIGSLAMMTVPFGCSSKKEVKEKKNQQIVQVEQHGMWYAGTQDALSYQLDTYLKKAKINVKKDTIALIVPHAGYQYSAQTAAYAFKTVENLKFKRVLVIGPSHQYPLQNKIAVPSGDVYSTPLKNTPIDNQFIDELSKSGFIEKTNLPFQREHSVDNQIPFAQKVIPDFKIVPMIMGHFDMISLIKLSDHIKKLLDEETLIVVSSDFTHYGASFGYLPFTTNIKNNLEKLDLGAANLIVKGDSQGFLSYLQKTQATICGSFPIALLLHLLPKKFKGDILRYDTSGALTGDFRHCVSYLSIGFTGKWKMEKNDFTSKEKKGLLNLARKVLSTYLKKGKMPSIEDVGISITDNMKNINGAFVTLTKKGQLRGCIGEILPQRELYKAVMDRAVDAAVHDHRFSPVTLEELDEIKIEISVLTPPHPVDSYNDIVIGKHGMILSKKGYSAVFLPQVAPEQGWDLDTTLTHLSLKAGLSPQDWKTDTKFQVFEAIVFHE